MGETLTMTWCRKRGLGARAWTQYGLAEIGKSGKRRQFDWYSIGRPGSPKEPRIFRADRDKNRFCARRARRRPALEAAHPKAAAALLKARESQAGQRFTPDSIIPGGDQMFGGGGGCKWFVMSEIENFQGV